MNIRIILLSLAGIFLSFFGLFGWSSYQYYTLVHADDPIDPKLTITTGIGKIIRSDLTYELSQSEEYILATNDIIETGLESSATILWPDKSVTRLGPKTRITIQKMYVALGYEKIEIAYSMERGKVWNTVIRSLIGDSYFQVQLPKESIVAGVRGTTFEINLENRYIRAIEHSTLLSQNEKLLELLPGDLVDSENIFLKKGKEYIDATWNEINTQADALYETYKNSQIKSRIEGLTQDIGKINIGNLSRSVLENIAGFEDIRIAKVLETGSTGALRTITPESILSYYQRLGNSWGGENRETLRNALLENDSEFIANIRESLQFQALIESIDTGALKNSARAYLQSKGLNVDEFSTRFMSGAKGDIDTFRSLLSGALLPLSK